MFSKDPRIDMHLNNGLFNGKIIYIHYTSQAGHTAIMAQRKISANPNWDRRGANAKKGAYLTLAKDAMNGSTAHLDLFLGEEKYTNSATHCIVFTFNNMPYMASHPVSSGSNRTEVICLSDIHFHAINIIFDGKNPFA